jgi:pimeloyl-ACP methyl ester carboxylesterase
MRLNRAKSLPIVVSHSWCDLTEDRLTARNREVVTTETKNMAYLRLHSDPGFNFTLNRLAQTIPAEEVRTVAAEIDSLESWISKMLAAGERAEQEGRYAEAARYLQGAEFYMKQGHAGKHDVYQRSIELTDRALLQLAEARESVPYLAGNLPAIRLPAEGEERDIIVMHSGFDGLLEEMYPLLPAFTAAGYTVIAFEGPGQGGALRKDNLPMPYDWEKPVSAVLDHYKIDRCTLIGMSLGGYLAPRAAAFEERVARVVAWGAMFDFFESYKKRVGKLQAGLLGLLLDLGLTGTVNNILDTARKRDGIIDWAIGHGKHVSGTSSPAQFLQWVRSLNLRDCAHLIHQDVLLIMGTEDHLVPSNQLYVQAQAMVQARSVTSVMMSAKDESAEHCQVGNPGLAVTQIIDWLGSLARRDT